MKLKTSITLSSDLLEEIDRNAGSKASRSAFIEAVMREYLKEKVREAINRRDAELINANIDYLNREALDVLRYQAPIDWTTDVAPEGNYEELDTEEDTAPAKPGKPPAGTPPTLGGKAGAPPKAGKP